MNFFSLSKKHMTKIDKSGKWWISETPEAIGDFLITWNHLEASLPSGCIGCTKTSGDADTLAEVLLYTTESRSFVPRCVLSPLFE